jgi:ribonucleoside-triphosphate reductase (formate)
LNVIKRDGTEVPYNGNLIINAVNKAAEACNYTDHKLSTFVENSVREAIKNQEKVSITEIQDIVEKCLMCEHYHEVAKAYIEYRHDRDKAREKNSQLIQDIEGLIEQNNPDILNENANKDSRIIPTQRDLLAGIMARHYAKKHMLPSDIVQAHEEGYIHFHDLDYSPLFPMFNCFSGDTKFIHSNGVNSFSQFNDGDKVFVPTHDGLWKNATVRHYGKQKLNEVVLKRGRSTTKTIKVTKNHRWLLKDGSITTDLKVGNHLIKTPCMDLTKTGDHNYENHDLMWIYGFLFGDGNNTSYGSRIRLCGNKKQYVEMFKKYFPVTYPKSFNGDALVTLKNVKKQLLDLRLMRVNEISMWIDGFLSADGCRNNGDRGSNKFFSVQITGELENEILSQALQISGYYISSKQDKTHISTNYGERTSLTINYQIQANQSYRNWKVIAIEEDVIEEDVWCLEVEDNNSFILDGGVVTGNCMLIDIGGMLTHGFKMGNAEIETPRSICTATAVTAQIIAQVASHIYGGTTINRIDEVLAPYVLKSYEKNLNVAKEWNIPEAESYAKARTEKECYDAFQALEYEINTLHTSNGQTPFVTLGFGLGTSWASKLIQKSILKNRINGLGKNHKTPVFPKLIFTICRGINKDKNNVNYDVKQLALECATKRMYPDIVNYGQVVEVTGSFKAPMGCRSFLAPYYDDKGKLVHSGRNNLGVVSINLPRIALEAKKNIDKFYELLDAKLDVCFRALLERIRRLDNVTASVAPILYMEGACGVRLKASDKVSEIFKNGRASVSLGYIGVYEAVNALCGTDTHIFDSEELRKLGLNIVKKLHDATEQWREDTGYGFSLYGTPSENLCNRFCKLDSKKFGIIPGVTDKGYYTNSFHLDVAKKVDPYSKIDFEKDYPALSSGGFISFCEFPSLINNQEALEDVWDYSYDKVPYFGTNTPIDECYECGYKGEFTCTSKGFECPNCGNREPGKASVIRRVCGYLGAPDTRPFNTGKQKEVSRRVKHL